MRRLIEWAARLGTLGLMGLALGLGFGESAIGLDLVVPGEVGMVFLGAATREADVALPLVILAGAIGAIAGDTFGYFIGRRFGVRIVHRYRWTRRHFEPSVKRAHRYFERRGGPAVFGARWIGALRAVVPLVAGTSAMPLRRFLAWDAAAALLWTTAAVSIGYIFGDDIAGAVDRVGWWISLAALTVLAVVFLVRRRRRHA
jgi:membrane protein DedA with SNARE-associated domain